MREQFFNDLCAEFEQQTVQFMLATRPEDAKTREHIYASIQGKRDFITLMASYVDARDKIIQKRQHPAEDLDDFSL